MLLTSVSKFETNSRVPAKREPESVDSLLTDEFKHRQIHVSSGPSFGRTTTDFVSHFTRLISPLLTGGYKIRGTPLRGNQK
jgi:hypothetical protein